MPAEAPIRNRSLTDGEVAEIHRLTNEGCQGCGRPLTGLEVAKRFYTSPSTVSRIKLGLYAANGNGNGNGGD